MYKIVGADGKEYGPIDATQLRQWIAENRARGETLIQREGESDWKPLSSFPEFADLFASTGASPSAGSTTSAPPPPRAGDPNQLVAAALARGVRIDAMSCLGRGWDLVMNRFWLSVGVGVVCTVISNVPLLCGPAYTCLFWFFLRQLRSGNQAKFEDAFEPFSAVLLQSFLAGVVVTILLTIGFALCIIPGLIFGALWVFTWPLLMDKRLDFWPAMEVSRCVLWPHIWSVLWLWVLSLLLLIAGLLCCYVGLFVAMPVIAAAHACAYEDFFGNPALPKPAGV